MWTCAGIHCAREHSRRPKHSARQRHPFDRLGRRAPWDSFECCMVRPKRLSVCVCVCVLTSVCRPGRRHFRRVARRLDEDDECSRAAGVVQDPVVAEPPCARPGRGVAACMRIDARTRRRRVGPSLRLVGGVCRCPMTSAKISWTATSAPRLCRPGQAGAGHAPPGATSGGNGLRAQSRKQRRRLRNNVVACNRRRWPCAWSSPREIGRAFLDEIASMIFMLVATIVVNQSRVEECFAH